MYRIKLSFLCFFLLAAHGISQPSALYRSIPMVFPSDITQERFTLDISVPESFHYTSENHVYPLIILLDSHNEYTYRYNLQSIEILTFHAQIPEAVIVGIPFQEYNRFYLTSPSRTPGDSLTGMEKTEHFLFEELIPFLRQSYRAAGPVIILGHSRTAYLTSYLMTRRFMDFHMAGSFSGFLSVGFSLEDQEDFLETKNKAGSGNFSWYFSAGSLNPEEKVYHADMTAISDFLKQHPRQNEIRWQFIENPYAGHMMNYNLSVVKALNDYFGPFSQVLSSWLFEKLPTDPDNPLALLKNDFSLIQQYYGAAIHPQTHHIISISNYFINNGQWKEAREILSWGLEYYPGDYYVNYLMAFCKAAEGDFESSVKLIEKIMNQLTNDLNIGDEDRSEWLFEFRGLLESLPE